MSFIGITIEILEYLPQNFNFDNFSFIFSSESKDFEKEISFLNKNSISQKIPLPRKNLRYSIKVTKKNSLVGISDLIIPLTVFSKKENTFDKLCQVTMTDSIRRLIFGSISSSNSLRINIRSIIQYLDKGEKSLKQAESSLSMKKDEKRSSTPKKFENSLKKMKFSQNSSNNLKINKEEKKPMHKKLTEDKKRSQSKTNINSLSLNGVSNNIKMKNDQQQNTRLKEEIINSNNNLQKEEYGEDQFDNSLIDENLKSPTNYSTSEFFDFLQNFEKKYPIEKLDEFPDPNEMINYTKKIINELLDYQLNYYDILNHTMNLNRKFNELLVKYNEKYRLTLKKIDRIEEENKKNEIQTDLITNIQRNDFNNLKKLIPLKQNEFDLYKEMYSINWDENEIQKYSEEQMKQLEEKRSKDNNTQLLLIRVLKNIYNKFGPLNKILNKSNSNENEINNIITLSAKYNLPLNEELLGNTEDIQFQHVFSSNPDDTDNKLEMYLRYFYSQRKVPKITFKKISNNIYEYGTQKVTIKIEGNLIKAKTIGGFILLDKFIENNALIEEGKMKNSASKNSLNNKKKKK